MVVPFADWDHVGGNEELKQKYGAKIVRAQRILPLTYLSHFVIGRFMLFARFVAQMRSFWLADTLCVRINNS